MRGIPRGHEQWEWTPTAIGRLRELWDDRSLSAADIGLRMGRSKNAILGKGRRLGLPGRPSPITARLPDELIGKIKAAKLSGLSQRQIAVTFGVSKSAAAIHSKGVRPTTSRPMRAEPSLPPLLSMMAETEDALEQIAASTRFGGDRIAARVPVRMHGRLYARQQAALGRRPPMPVAVPAVPVPPRTPPNRAGDGCQWTDSERRPWVFCGKPVTFRQKVEEDGSRSLRWSAYCEAHHCRCYTARPALVAEAA